LQVEGCWLQVRTGRVRGFPDALDWRCAAGQLALREFLPEQPFATARTIRIHLWREEAGLATFLGLEVPLEDEAD